MEAFRPTELEDFMTRIGLGLAAVLAVSPAFGQEVDGVPVGDVATGAGLYFSYCAACHGLEARGDGEMADILTVLPADLTRLSQANDGVFPVTDVVRQIDGRDPLLAHGGVMPLFGDFFQGDDVAIPSEAGQPIMTSRAIADLTAFLRVIQE